MKPMETEYVEAAAGLEFYRERWKQLDPVVTRMLGSYREPTAHPRELRRKLAKQTGPISVSRMIVESR